MKSSCFWRQFVFFTVCNETVNSLYGTVFLMTPLDVAPCSTRYQRHLLSPVCITENGGSMVLQNMHISLPDYTKLHPLRPQSQYSLLKFQSLFGFCMTFLVREWNYPVNACPGTGILLLEEVQKLRWWMWLCTKTAVHRLNVSTVRNFNGKTSELCNQSNTTSAETTISISLEKLTIWPKYPMLFLGTVL
jgi:hypothetical protein